jgi:hypothetical protein
MSTVIVTILLLGFCCCVVVGLIAVLQNLVNHHPFDDPAPGSMVPERSDS